MNITQAIVVAAPPAIRLRFFLSRGLSSEKQSAMLSRVLSSLLEWVRLNMTDGVFGDEVGRIVETLAEEAACATAIKRALA